MNRGLSIFVAIFFILNFSSNLLAQCSFSGNQTVTHADVISCLSGCTTNCTIDIEDNAVITLAEKEVWDLVSDPGKDVTLTIKGDGQLFFDGSGNGKAAELIMTTNSLLIIEDTNNSEALKAANNGNVRITIGTQTYQGKDFTEIIDAGGADSSGPLPVELTSFTANTTDESVVLSWTTASEQNNDYFTLERSKNGRDFEVLGTVDGQGTTTVTSIYSFKDQSPYLGLSFYRLSQTDFDGAFEVFPAISVLFTSDNNTFSISPNPIRNQSVTFKVSGRVKNEPLDLKIMDLQGRLVEALQFRADHFGNLETEILLHKQLRKGTYIFELSSANYKEYVKVISE